MDQLPIILLSKQLKYNLTADKVKTLEKARQLLKVNVGNMNMGNGRSIAPSSLSSSDPAINVRVGDQNDADADIKIVKYITKIQVENTNANNSNIVSNNNEGNRALGSKMAPSKMEEYKVKKIESIVQKYDGIGQEVYRKMMDGIQLVKNDKVNMYETPKVNNRLSRHKMDVQQSQSSERKGNKMKLEMNPGNILTSSSQRKNQSRQIRENEVRISQMMKRINQRQRQGRNTITADHNNNLDKKKAKWLGKLQENINLDVDVEEQASHLEEDRSMLLNGNGNVDVDGKKQEQEDDDLIAMVPQERAGKVQEKDSSSLGMQLEDEDIQIEEGQTNKNKNKDKENLTGKQQQQQSQSQSSSSSKSKEEEQQLFTSIVKRPSFIEIYGEKGTGKTSLMLYIVKQYMERFKDNRVMILNCGSGVTRARLDNLVMVNRQRQRQRDGDGDRDGQKQKQKLEYYDIFSGEEGKSYCMRFVEKIEKESQALRQGYDLNVNKKNDVNQRQQQEQQKSKQQKQHLQQNDQKPKKKKVSKLSSNKASKPISTSYSAMKAEAKKRSQGLVLVDSVTNFFLGEQRIKSSITNLFNILQMLKQNYGMTVVFTNYLYQKIEYHRQGGGSEQNMMDGKEKERHNHNHNQNHSRENSYNHVFNHQSYFNFYHAQYIDQKMFVERERDHCMMENENQNQNQEIEMIQGQGDGRMGNGLQRQRQRRPNRELGYLVRGVKGIQFQGKFFVGKEGLYEIFITKTW